MKIELSTTPTPQQLCAISKGIAAFNAQYMQCDGEFDSGCRFVITVQNEAGDIIGGLQASIIWSYCLLELLWLSEHTRGLGIGSKLMQRLEEFASSKGLHQIRTETLDFQAKPFYEKLGYQVYGELADTPPGHTSYFLVKNL
ncbi:GNAT family N-acetyltransferase [Pseudoalteromonas byunsanensis]|uniref:GNAT family N-acetyltransferase n=1 Tax=Pseudoalteromonas byunsanensis TaxID=327939 RepID=A0A1S1N6I3_9GAMM|nr:GNAT family N-acetyltransferase [Pseudoalteromonas byunsanensis]OHU93871.1 GNAT family N-acetyltransferase [Pseudoalteromonas byunsanensis]